MPLARRTLPRRRTYGELMTTSWTLAPHLTLPLVYRIPEPVPYCSLPPYPTTYLVLILTPLLPVRVPPTDAVATLSVRGCAARPVTAQTPLRNTAGLFLCRMLTDRRSIFGLVYCLPYHPLQLFLHYRFVPYPC